MTIPRSLGGISFTTAMGGRAVISGGHDTAAYVETYNPATGAWAASTNTMVIGGLSLNVQVTLADGRVLINGGQYTSGCGLLRSVLTHIYDATTNLVTQTGSMAFGRVLNQVARGAAARRPAFRKPPARRSTARSAATPS